MRRSHESAIRGVAPVKSTNRYSWIAACVLFVLIGVGLDALGGAILARMQGAARAGAQAGSVNLFLENLDRDLLVFGSSRAVYHIDPEILEAELGLTGYNGGELGQGIQYAYALAAFAVDAGTSARVFVLQVDEANLFESQSVRLGRLMPYYGRVDVVDQMLERIGPTAQLKLSSSTYRYNSLLLPVVVSLLRGAVPESNGFVPLRRKAGLEERSHATALSERAIDPITVRALRDFLRDACAAGIETVVIMGPRWRPDGWRAEELVAQQAYAEIVAEEGGHFARLATEEVPAFRDEALWADTAHLTPEGAVVLSHALSDEIRRIGVPQARGGREIRAACQKATSL